MMVIFCENFRFCKACHLLLNKVQFLENFIMHPARPKAGHCLRLWTGEAGQVACMLRTLLYEHIRSKKDKSKMLTKTGFYNFTILWSAHIRYVKEKPLFKETYNWLLKVIVTTGNWTKICPYRVRKMLSNSIYTCRVCKTKPHFNEPKTGYYSLLH